MQNKKISCNDSPDYGTLRGGRLMPEQEKLQKKRRETAKKLSRPRPIELPSGKWRCQLMVNGERISVIDEDPAVAHAKILAMKAGVIEREKDPKTLSVGAAIDRYIESKDSVLSPSTLLGYKRLRKNTMKDLMPIKLGDLTQEAVQRSVNKMSKTLSPKSIRNAHGLLSAVLSVYRPNFVLRTTLPQKNPTNITIPDMDEIQKILTVSKGTEMELPILLAVWLGLRSSEIRGLTWDSIDGDFLNITQAIVEGENGPAVKGTKTFSGTRSIRVPEHIKEVIEKQPHKENYVIPLSGHAMYSRFSRLCEQAGVKHYRFHDLRHTAASVAMSIGVPNTYTQKRMGHKTDNMLKTVYLHTMKSKEDEYADKIDSTFEALLPK